MTPLELLQGCDQRRAIRDRVGVDEVAALIVGRPADCVPTRLGQHDRSLRGMARRDHDELVIAEVGVALQAVRGIPRQCLGTCARGRTRKS